MVITDEQGNRIRKAGNGLWYVKPYNQTAYSATHSSTVGKAEAHLAKLLKGLSVFTPLSGNFDHHPGFKPGFCNGATARHRLT
jgi:hypothetical protein